MSSRPRENHNHDQNMNFIISRENFNKSIQSNISIWVRLIDFKAMFSGVIDKFLNFSKIEILKYAVKS